MTMRPHLRLARPLLLGLALAMGISGLASAQAVAPDPEAEPATPQERAAPEVAFNAGVASDYVFRGFSKTDEGPQVFAGVDAYSGALYAGAWASNVRLGGEHRLELDLYAGWRPEAAGFTLDLGAIYYAYPGEAAEIDDFVELSLGASRSIGPATAGAVLYWAPDYFGQGGAGLYAEANGAVELGPRTSLSAALGRQSIENGDDYAAWNLGLAYVLSDRLTLDGRYWDTAGETLSERFDRRLVLGLKAVF